MPLETIIKEKETKRVLLVQPRTTHHGGINFELVSILRLGLPILAGALRDYNGTLGSRYNYETAIWLEDRVGPLDMRYARDFKPDAILITGLVNEIPRAYNLSHLLREEFPGVPQVGGGPHMSAIPGEALHFGCFDAIGHGQGTRYIGALLDSVIRFEGEDRKKALDKLPFISRMEQGRLTGKGSLLPMGLEAAPSPLPDYDSIVGLTKESPLPAGTIQLSDSCPYRCTFCRVWTHNGDFVQLEGSTQEARWKQLNQLAERGLLYKSRRDGKTLVFIVDDLAAWGLATEDNLPPGWTMEKFRAVRQARLEEYRALESLDFMDRFGTVAQIRIAHGDDNEMIDAMVRGARNKMSYAGIEATDDMSLKVMNKRQSAADFERQVLNLRNHGVRVTGMGIIGLPHQTEKVIMEQAQWFDRNTDYATVNYITHLWGTTDANGSQWGLFANKAGDIMPMVGMDGRVIQVSGGKPLIPGAKVLRPAELPPYEELFTGRWATFRDPDTQRNWGPRESHAIVERYYGAIKPVDRLYELAAKAAKLVEKVGGEWVPISRLASERLLQTMYQSGNSSA